MHQNIKIDHFDLLHDSLSVHTDSSSAAAYATNELKNNDEQKKETI